MTLLTPLKHITTFKFSKLPVLGGTFLRRQMLRVRTTEQLKQARIVTAETNLTVELTANLASPLSETPIPASELAPMSPLEVWAQLGSKLREWREYHHLSIDDMSARTQIQPRLIQAIESGHVEMLPEPVYVKGMIKRYADSLGLNGTAIANQMPIWAPEAAKSTVISQQTAGFNPVPQLKPLHIYFGYTLVILGMGVGTSHLIDNTVNPQLTVSKNPIPTEQVAVISATVPQLPDVKIEIAVKDPTWAQIGIDGTTKFTGSLKVGTQFNWIAKKQVTINTNNAGGLLFARDGQPLQPLGKIGQKQTVTIKVSK